MDDLNKISLEWFFKYPGLLITCGVLLILIAIILHHHIPVLIFLIQSYYHLPISRFIPQIRISVSIALYLTFSKL